MTSLPKYKSYKNADFYTLEGKFITEIAKNAYYEMMEFFKYPISTRPLVEMTVGRQDILARQRLCITCTVSARI